MIHLQEKQGLNSYNPASIVGPSVTGLKDIGKRKWLMRAAGDAEQREYHLINSEPLSLDLLSQKEKNAVRKLNRTRTCDYMKKIEQVSLV